MSRPTRGEVKAVAALLEEPAEDSEELAERIISALDAARADRERYATVAWLPGTGEVGEEDYGLWVMVHATFSPAFNAAAALTLSPDRWKRGRTAVAPVVRSARDAWVGHSPNRPTSRDDFNGLMRGGGG